MKTTEDAVILCLFFRIAESIGSGEFGDVKKGYWKSADYSVPVALKTLSGTQDQDGRTKLLQEAAIMSQFKHPNVVKLFGIASAEHEVMHLVYIIYSLNLVFSCCFMHRLY